MTSVSENRERAAIQNYVSPVTQNNRTNGKLYFYNGSYQMVFEDGENGNKEYIMDKSGKKVYLQDIALLQMKDDLQSQKDSIMKGLDNQKAQYKKWKDHWFEKLQLANENYNFFREAKKLASKGYQHILSQTGCSSFSDLKEYQKANGGDYLKQAKAYLVQRSDAVSGIIRSESDSFFYGRMYVDESQNMTEVEYQKAIANSIFASS